MDDAIAVPGVAPGTAPSDPSTPGARAGGHRARPVFNRIWIDDAGLFPAGFVVT